MKKLILVLLLVLILLCTVACMMHKDPTTTPPTESPTIVTTGTTAPKQTTVPTTQPPVIEGWHEENGLLYYYQDNQPVTGWHCIDDKDRYFYSDGVLASGWANLGGSSYYFDREGCPQLGWLELEEKTYYMGDDGAMVTGWLELEQVRYYFKDDGTMARGCVQIDGVNRYFTSTGAYLVVVNPWNYVPEDYDPDIIPLDRFANYANMYISRACYDDLMAMLADCKAQASLALVVSSYRTQEFQERNFARKVQEYLNAGYSREEAERRAARVVAVPGTSEHQLGLAVDIVDATYPYLNNAQATTKAQKWLMEHCWEYGFILRYPANKTDETGIIYEPWHYRYVGKELAKELYELGMTVEAYMASLTETK